MNKTLEHIRELSKIEFLPILSEECEELIIRLMKEEKPTNILEIGTCVGYSSSIMLLNSEAHIDTIELDAERQRVAKSVWDAQNLQDRVHGHIPVHHHPAVYLDHGDDLHRQRILFLAE